MIEFFFVLETGGSTWTRNGYQKDAECILALLQGDILMDSDLAVIRGRTLYDCPKFKEALFVLDQGHFDQSPGLVLWTAVYEQTAF